MHLCLLLSSLLFGAGLGSFASGTVPIQRLTHAIRMSSTGIAVAALLVASFLTPVFDLLQGSKLLPAVAAALLLVLLGFAMGFPFPLAIRFMKQTGFQNHIPWMWGINGLSSVFGSVLAMLASISVGYAATLVLGGVVYVGVALSTLGFRRELMGRLSP